ncbi:MAG TPA: hypothetical protein VD906_02600 [Caulobacteraceae bacterium]|nr:hypothetical protein [Caulobacteraceae bacterium]
MSLAHTISPAARSADDLPEGAPKVRDRLAIRYSTEYVLRSIDLMTNAVGGDLVKGLIFVAIVQANTQHIITDEVLNQAYSESDKAPPDEARRPVSVHALSVSLGIPYETTRRYVNKLLSDGYCQRVRRGLVVPGEVLTRPEMVMGLKRNFANLQRLSAGLRRAGVEF